MKKVLEVAVILSAVDKMTRVIDEATAKSQAKLKQMQDQSSKLMGNGMGMIGAGVALGASLAPAVAAYAELEDASVRLKTSMMESGGRINALFEGVNGLALELGNRLPGTTADFQGMFEVLLNNGVKAQSILDGVGQGAAYLAVALKMPYEEAARFAAKMKEATGVIDQDMEKLLDTIARTKNLGVEVGEMQYAFGRSAGALKLMGIQGLEASKSMAAVYASLVRAGLSGETVGTGFAAIFDSMLNPKKMKATQEAAQALGVSLEFMDSKTGQFKGVENMIAQLDKLRNFTPAERSGIVNALTGGGQDAQMLQTLITNGIEGFNKMQGAMQNQADLNDKVNMQLGTMKNLWEATTGTATNMLAAFGETFAPELKKIVGLLSKIAEGVQAWVKNNPELAKTIALVVGVSSAVMIVVGAIMVLKGAFIMLNMVVLANPIVAAIAAIVVIVTVLVIRWHALVDWWKKSSVVMKVLLAPLALALSGLLMIAWAIRKVIDNWDSIVKFFTKLANIINNIGPIFKQAGKKIVSSIADGIMAGINKVKDAIGKVTKAARDYLPFSPAKEGAFKDLHKIKIVETIAGAIKPAPLVRAMAMTTAAAVGVSPMTSGVRGGGSQSAGMVTVHYAPSINVSGGSTGTVDFQALLKQHEREIVRVIEEAQRKTNRTKF